MSLQATFGPPPTTQVLRKRRRVALACTACRQRKSRCNGLRPTCSACNALKLPCVYEPPTCSQSAGNIRFKREQPTHAQLARRVRELEARLDSTDVEPPRSSASSGLEAAEDDNAVDTLATNAFNEVPEYNIGYFGPSSNHALFRVLSSAFASQVPRLFHTSEYAGGTSSLEISPQRLDVLSEKIPEDVRRQRRSKQPVDPLELCRDYGRISFLINCFFDHVGLVLPYVEKSCLLLDDARPGHKPVWQTSKHGRALLNIVCAHADASLGRIHDRHELFYRRTLALLDEKTLRGSSLELVQTLLLLCNFQQNTQRSISSWTYHAIAVRAALQLGLHSPEFHEGSSMQNQDLCKRVWFGIVNQDVSLSVCLGRPRLIPRQHVRVEPPRDHAAIRHSIPLVDRADIDTLVYFNRLISLHDIKAMAVETLYDHNIGPVEMEPSQVAIARLQLLSKLEQWRVACPSLCAIKSSTEMAGWSSTAYTGNKFAVLLSLHYYSTVLLIDGPILKSFLAACGSTRDAAAVTDSQISAIRDDFGAASELEQLVRRLDAANNFIDFGAVWWTCNYSMFTVNLHLFGILLACQREESSSLRLMALEPTAVRQALEAGLETLEAVERTSLMSRKGRHCLRRFLQLFDSMTSGTLGDQSCSNLTAVVDPQASAQLDDYFSLLIAQSAEEFMSQNNQLAFLDADMGMDGIY